METFISDISKKEFPESDKVQGIAIRPGILELIRKDHPDFDDRHCLAVSELNIYREKYIAELMSREMGELTDLETAVLNSIKEGSVLSDKLDGDDKKNLTFGQRLADHVAEFGGSWTFIIAFWVFLAIWILFNIFWMAGRAFDPYPFILLNLILSCIAAIQAPVIMMSQNRQEEKDRERARKDYMINLKSELEIRLIHEKLDHLIMHQQQELMEVQQVQMEMMAEILKRTEQK